MDSLINEVLREMGVDENAPPHWVQNYYISQANPPLGGKVPDGYICSRCGKKECYKKEICDACGSVMTNPEPPTTIKKRKGIQRWKITIL